MKWSYRHIDSAAAYFNEEDVGKAVRDSGIPREEIFITSKLWLQDHGYEEAKKGIARSLRKLDLGYPASIGTAFTEEKRARPNRTSKAFRRCGCWLKI